jgi:hypothetical protein
MTWGSLPVTQNSMKGRTIMRRRLLALGITAVAVWGTASASAVAEPTLTLHEFCEPGVNGPRYGFRAESSGLTPGGIYDLVWDFGGGDGGATDAVGQADANGNIVWREPHAIGRPVKWVTVDLIQHLPVHVNPLAEARLHKPCKHADKNR